MKRPDSEHFMIATMAIMIVIFLVFCVSMAISDPPDVTHQHLEEELKACQEQIASATAIIDSIKGAGQ